MPARLCRLSRRKLYDEMLASKLFFPLTIFQLSCALIEKFSDSKDGIQRRWPTTSTDERFPSETSKVAEEFSRRKNVGKIEIAEVPNFENDFIYEQTYSANGVANQLLQVSRIFLPHGRLKLA